MLKVYLSVGLIILQVVFPKEAYGNSVNDKALLTEFVHENESCRLDRNKISGFVDGVENNHLTGWACEHGEKNPVKIQIYVGISSQKGQNLSAIKESIANLKSEPELSPWCKTQGGAHRFSIPLGNWANQHRGKFVHVFGISSMGQCKKQQLFGSGATIPKIP